MTSSDKEFFHINSLTSLRIFAASYVLIYHYWQSAFPGKSMPVGISLGFSGVTFFFILSGFVLAYNYERDGRFEPGGMRRYLVARCARIWPLYVLSLVVFLPFLASDIMRHGIDARMATALMTTPLALQAWVPGAATAINYPGWSISAEVFFYLIFPFLVAPVFRKPGATIFFVSLLMLATWMGQSIVWQTWGEGWSLTGNNFALDGAASERVAEFIKYFPPGRVGEFVLGVALCALWKGGSIPTDGRILVLASGVAILGLLFLAPELPSIALHGGGTAIVWVPLILWGARGARALTHPTLVLLGRASFALYLLHAPVDYWARAFDKYLMAGWLAAHPMSALALKAGATLIAAIAAHRWLEEPARRWILRRYGELTISVRNAAANRALVIDGQAIRGRQR